MYILLLSIIVILKYSLEDVTFNILHTGDIHAHFNETSSIASIVQREKSAEQSIYLDSGDIFTGSLYFVIGGAQISADVMKALRPDGLALGNHEFDKNISGLEHYLSHIGQEVLCCNCILKEEPTIEKHVKPSKTFEIAGCKVAIVGYINKGYRTQEYFGKVQFADEKKSIETEVKQLRDKGIKIIILLGHGGYDLDKTIAKKTRHISVIVGGHTHTYLAPKSTTIKLPTEPSGPYPTVVQNLDGKNVPIVHAFCDGWLVGKLRVTFNNDGAATKYVGSLIEVKKSNVPPNSEISKILAKYEGKITKYRQEKVGNTTTVLSRMCCRRHECALGNLVVDSFVDYYVRRHQATPTSVGKAWSNVGVAFMNSGGLRAGLTESNQGRISMGDIATCLPFNNRIVLFEMTGATFKKALERSISWGEDTSKGEFLQYSGVRVIYDYSKPVGERVVRAWVRCGEGPVPTYEPLQPKRKYKALSIEFLAAGSDGYTMLRNESVLLEMSMELDFEIVEQYIRAKRLVQPQREQRILILNDNRPRSEGIVPDGACGICQANSHWIVILVLTILHQTRSF